MSPQAIFCKDNIMAIQNHTHSAAHIPTHGGLERVIERAEATQGLLSRIFAPKHLPTYVLGITIMAVVTLTERALDAIDTGFAVEWAALSLVALVTFGLFARVIVHGTQAAQTSFAEYAGRARKARADEKMWATAQRDSRIMNDILAAQGRADALLDEIAPAKRDTKSVRDDGLAPLAPWFQPTRYY
jgi:hypothetical protein